MATSEALHRTASGATQGKSLHIGLWVAQGVLAAAFFAAGLMKVTSPIEQLQANMPWVSGAMGPFVRWIGAVEVAGAVGLILPSATRIQPRLTVLAAVGLVLVMAGAAATHLARGEFAGLGAPVVIGLLAALIAWGRSKKAPIAPR